MFSIKDLKVLPAVIEIADSSDNNSDCEEDNSLLKRSTKNPTRTPSAESSSSTRDGSTTTSGTAVDETHPTESSDSNSTIKDLNLPPMKVYNRRKSVHHSIRSVENLSFDGDSSKKPRIELPDMDIKTKRLNDKLDAAVDGDIDDPEMAQILKKIAYYRVFTNYLLRQYNMLTIDFKLYSNFDLLMLELKKRVDTYTAIKSSRMCLRGVEGDQK